jgi:hypothetical protein
VNLGNISVCQYPSIKYTPSDFRWSIGQQMGEEGHLHLDNTTAEGAERGGGDGQVHSNGRCLAMSLIGRGANEQSIPEEGGGRGRSTCALTFGLLCRIGPGHWHRTSDYRIGSSQFPLYKCRHLRKFYFSIFGIKLNCLIFLNIKNVTNLGPFHLENGLYCNNYGQKEYKQKRKKPKF